MVLLSRNGLSSAGGERVGSLAQLADGAGDEGEEGADLEGGLVGLEEQGGREEALVNMV